MPEDRLPLALFDLDDTLCDYSSARLIRLRIALSHAGDLDDATLVRMIEQSIRDHPHGSAHFPELFAAYGVEDPEIAAAASAWFRANRFHGLELFPDTIRVLEEIRRAGHPIGLITNGPAEVQRAKIELLGVGDLVDFALVSGEFGVEKPDPAIFMAALDLGGREPEEAIHVGDMLEYDVAGANNAGIRSVWMNRRGVTRDANTPTPAHETANLDEMAALLRGWPNA